MFAETGPLPGECSVFCGNPIRRCISTIEAVSATGFRTLARERREGACEHATRPRPRAPLRARRVNRPQANRAATSAWSRSCFFIAGGVLALIMRTQLAADGGVVSQDTYDELFTMHGSTMVYLFVVPVALAAGLYLVPLQVGAAEIAGPRARSRDCGC